MSARHANLLAVVHRTASSAAVPEHSNQQDSSSSKSQKALSAKLKKREIILKVHHASTARPRGGSQGKLELSDLLNPLERSGTSGVQASAVKSSIKELVKDKKTQAVGLPLSSVEMQRITRKANYKVADGKARQWLHKLKQMAKEDQTDFTQDEAGGKKIGLRGFTARQDEAENTEGVVAKMGREIKRELEGQCLDSQQSRREYEEQELGRGLTAEEIEKRVGELARMKHLLFREEAKRKRVAKIKSKLYHKIKKRDKEKTESSILAKLDAIDPETAQKYRAQQQQERAEERARQRHATTSKFARNLMRYGKKEKKETREAFHEMVRKREELHKKVKSVTGGGVLKDEDDDQVLSFFSDELEEEAQQLKREQAELEVQFNEPGVQKKKRVGEKGVMGMRFMQKAMEKEAAETREEISRMREENGEEESDNEEQERGSGGKFKGRGELDGKVSSQIVKEIVSGEVKRADQKKKARSKIEAQREESSSDSDSEDDGLGVDQGDVKEIEERGSSSLFNLQKAAQNLAQDQEEDELENDLLNRIFVGGQRGEQEGQFTAEKDRELEGGVQEEKKNLRGWNEWAGESIKPKQKNTVQLIARRKQKLKELKESRMDGQLQKVMLSERRDKQFKKYQLQELPLGYTGERQFQALMKVPLGKEWNTMGSYKRLIRPSVITKAGQVIGALKHRNVVPIETIDSLVKQRQKPARPAAKF